MEHDLSKAVNAFPWVFDNTSSKLQTLPAEWLLAIIAILVLLFVFKEQLVSCARYAYSRVDALLFEGRRMRLEREKFLNSAVADKIMDDLIELEEDPSIHMDADEKKLFAERFGRLLGVTDLLPKNDSRTLKQIIQDWRKQRAAAPAAVVHPQQALDNIFKRLKTVKP